MAGAVGLVAAAALVALGISCRQVVGITDNPPADLATTCGLPHGTTTCASCAQANCCTASNACATDKICRDYEGCLGACSGDPACRQRCAIDHPPGKGSDVTDLSVCLASKCENECGLTCGALAGWPVEPAAAAACEQCFETNACDVERACARSADCDAMHRCMVACPTEDCRQACQTSRGVVIDFSPRADGGSGRSEAFDAVRKGVCSTQCGTGGYWECVGKVSWPSPKPSTTTTIHFWVRDAISQSAIEGVQVSLCSSNDFVCAPPLQAGTTGATGEVSLPFLQATATAGLDGYLTIAADAGYLPEPNYWGFPLTESQWFTYEVFLTPGAGAQLRKGFGAPPADPNRGTVWVWVFDCLGDLAPGVKVGVKAADYQTVPGTPENGVGAPVTGASALVTFTNVPPGATTVTTEPLALDGGIAGTVLVPVSVQGDSGVTAGTFVHVYPTPLQ
jgi:hypothetical protein